MMCHRMGRPPTSTMGLGRNSVSSRSRVPKPPHRITTFTTIGPPATTGALSFLRWKGNYSGDTTGLLSRIWLWYCCGLKLWSALLKWQNPVETGQPTENRGDNQSKAIPREAVRASGGRGTVDDS